MIEEISTHSIFTTSELANKQCQKLNELEGSDNLNYVVKIQDGKYHVVLLAGFSDDSI